MTLIGRLESDQEYAQKVLGVCGLRSELDGGQPLRVNLLIQGGKVINVSYALYYEELMEGGIGPSANMGSVLWIGSLSDRIFIDGLSKLDMIFSKIPGSAFVSLNICVQEHEFKVISFEPDISIGFMELYKGDHKALFIDDTPEFKHGWALSITLAVLPFPMRIAYHETVEVIGLNKYNLKHITMYNLKEDGHKYVGIGHLGDVTAHGESVREARRRAYRTIDNLEIKGLMYRRDIGASVPRIYDSLCKQGWING